MDISCSFHIVHFVSSLARTSDLLAFMPIRVFSLGARAEDPYEDFISVVIASCAARGQSFTPTALFRIVPYRIPSRLSGGDEV